MARVRQVPSFSLLCSWLSFTCSPSLQPFWAILVSAHDPKPAPCPLSGCP